MKLTNLILIMLLLLCNCMSTNEFSKTDSTLNKKHIELLTNYIDNYISKNFIQKSYNVFIYGDILSFQVLISENRAPNCYYDVGEIAQKPFKKTVLNDNSAVFYYATFISSSKDLIPKCKSKDVVTDLRVKEFTLLSLCKKDLNVNKQLKGLNPIELFKQNASAIFCD